MTEISPREGGRFETVFSLSRVMPGLIQGLITIWRRRPRVIVAVYQDDIFLLLGYLLAKLTGLPLAVYFLDLYKCQVDRPEFRGWRWQKFLARWLEPRVFKRASRIMALTEPLAEHYINLYGREVVAVSGCAPFAGCEQKSQQISCDPMVIGYSGFINSARLDLLQKMIEVIGGNMNYQFRFFSPVSENQLKIIRLWADNVQLSATESEDALFHKIVGMRFALPSHYFC